MKWFAFNQELKVVRSSLRREAFQEIDGETLLGLQREDVLSIGVKTHVAKVLRAIGKLREKCGLHLRGKSKRLLSITTEATGPKPISGFTNIDQSAVVQVMIRLSINSTTPFTLAISNYR